MKCLYDSDSPRMLRDLVVELEALLRAENESAGNHRNVLLKSNALSVPDMRLLNATFALLLTFAACSPTSSATVASFDCRKANEYRLVVAANPNRKKDSDSGVPEDLNIVVGDEVISRIELPKESEVKNFSLNSIEKTKAGFKLKTDWGGNRDHYEIQFDFKCKGKNFYLYRVKKISFSTTKPDSGNFWDKRKSKITKIVPNLPVEKFVMTDYL